MDNSSVNVFRPCSPCRHGRTHHRYSEVLRQLDNTYIFFASDNDFISANTPARRQATAYEEDIRVLSTSAGRVYPRVIRDELVGNVDLAPTVAELTGLIAPDFVDGRSLVPLLRDKNYKPITGAARFWLSRGSPFPSGPGQNSSQPRDSRSRSILSKHS